MKNKKGLYLAILSLLSTWYGASAHIKTDRLTNGTVFRVCQTDPSYTLDSAVYNVYIPDTVQTIMGVFIHQHGCTMEGRGASAVYDIQYQAFARKWSLAVVGPDLYSASGNCHSWKNPDSGSGPALMKMLEEVGRLSGHPELAIVPWLLWGHSGGGYWAQAMMRDHPDRTMALFSYSPGLDPSWDYPEAAMKVPVMIRHAGRSGDACCWQSALNTYDRLRRKGGYVGIAYTPYQTHNFSYVRYMAIPFFESVLRQRLVPGNPGVMHDMNPDGAWLGDTLSLNTYRASEYKGDELSLCWLPDSLTAAKWKEYVITGTVVDRTPPPAPYGLGMAIVDNRTVVLSWKADADIESGIKYFNIYKGGQFVRRFPSTDDYQRFDTNGDDAFPSVTLPEMRLELTGIIIDDNKISVSAVNHFLLESAKTEFPQ